MDTRVFHNIVLYCDQSVFENELMKLVVDFKWSHNVHKIVLVHLAAHIASLMLANVAMVMSTQSGQTITCPTCWITSAGVDALQIAVVACEVIAVCKDTMHLRLAKSHRWQLLNLFASACLITAVVAHFYQDLGNVEAFGAAGVSFKWLGCKIDSQIC